MRFSALLLCCLAASAQAQAESVQACLELARQQTGQEVNIQKDCPTLFKELQNQNLLNSFDPPLAGSASVAQLAFFADSLRNVRNADLIRRDGLDRLLADILTIETGDAEPDWWQALLKWLDSIKPADREARYQWLQRWLEALKPTERAARIFVYCSIALLLALSAWLVLSELYQAGLFRKFSGGRQRTRYAKKRPQTYAFPSPPGFNPLTQQEQIGALLSQLTNALVIRKLLPADPSLTHRQLVGCFVAQTDGFESAFSRLVYESEPLLYGNRAVDSELVGYYRHEVQALLGKLPS